MSEQIPEIPELFSMSEGEAAELGYFFLDKNIYSDFGVTVEFLVDGDLESACLNAVRYESVLNASLFIPDIAKEFYNHYKNELNLEDQDEG